MAANTVSSLIDDAIEQGVPITRDALVAMLGIGDDEDLLQDWDIEIEIALAEVDYLDDGILGLDPMVLSILVTGAPVTVEQYRTLAWGPAIATNAENAVADYEARSALYHWYAARLS